MKTASTFMRLLWSATLCMPALSSLTDSEEEAAAAAASVVQEEPGRGEEFSSLCDKLREDIDSDKVYCDPKLYKFDFGNPTCKSLGPTVSVVVRPKNAKDVAAAIAVAREEDIELSVRSGGHSYSCNAVKQNSIHIDLRDLDSKEMIDNEIDDPPYEGEGKLLRFGTGNTFADLFELFDRDEYSIIHAEGYKVGVGGFYLHGGLQINSLVEKYGMGNETIRSLELVTAAGQILRFEEPRTRKLPDIPGQPFRYERSPVRVYDEDNNLLPGDDYNDLWDAVRTAGSSFAIVTEMTVQMWAEREPYTWYFIIQQSNKERLDIFFDAADDINVKLNLYHSYGLTNIIQFSLLDGPANEKENREECLKWLDGWFENNGVKLWRKTRLWGLPTQALDLLGLQGGRSDGGILYLWPTYVLTGVLVPFSAPSRDEIMLYMMKEFTSDPVSRFSCILGIASVSTENALEGEKVILLEYNCGPLKLQQERMRDVSRFLSDNWPGETLRHYNVPTNMGNEEEDDELTELYFGPELSTLRESKSQYDPDNVIFGYQGIKPL